MPYGYLLNRSRSWTQYYKSWLQKPGNTLGRLVHNLSVNIPPEYNPDTPYYSINHGNVIDKNLYDQLQAKLGDALRKFLYNDETGGLLDTRLSVVHSEAERIMENVHISHKNWAIFQYIKTSMHVDKQQQSCLP
jgi:hypothetical protein